MNSFEKILSNQWVQILLLLFIFWFLFLREDFNEIPTKETSCERCNKQILTNNMEPLLFKNKCLGLDGKYINNNGKRECTNYKAKLDSNYRCNCEIN